jgi:hypothetical protein
MAPPSTGAAGDGPTGTGCTIGGDPVDVSEGAAPADPGWVMPPAGRAGDDVVAGDVAGDDVS